MLARLFCCLILLLASPAWAVVSPVASTSTAPFDNRTTLVLALPSGVQAGDLLLAQVVVDNAATVTAPSGWTVLDSNNNIVRQTLYYRFAGASEPTSFTWSWSSSGNRRAGGGITAYRGVDPSQPFGGVASNIGIGTSLPAPAQIVVEPDSLLVTLFAQDRGTVVWTTPAAMTRAYRFSSAANSGVSVLASYEQRPSAGSTGTRTAGSDENFSWIAHSLLLLPVPVPTAPPASLLEWRMNESSWTGAVGEVNDVSGNGLHGRAFGSANTADTAPALSGDPGTCRYGEFNGSDQYLAVADNSQLDLTGSFTIGAWIHPTALGSELKSILSKDGNYELHLDSSGRLYWWWQVAGNVRTLTSTASIATNVWTHVAIRFVPGSQTLFINGRAAATASYPETPLSNGLPLQIGQDQGASGRFFQGRLDEVHIFNSALSSGQVLSLMSQRRSCPVPPLNCFSDDFARSNLDSDWVTASRSGTFGQPRIVNNRLRLTDDTNNVATAATLQRLFPAANNLIEIQFNYNAYSNKSSRGADGIAVILSDAQITPQPGSFGGSLGYAQRDTTDSGFAGGWLGIGLDEYGNFSNQTEGRRGGVGFRSDAIAIRGSGSGTDGYTYLAGSTSLSPGVDATSATSTAAPNHRYRIRVDSRTSQSLVSVERDTTGTGNSYQTLIAPFDARAQSSQASVPADFWLSFTGSTGGSVNIHELDDLQVCALQVKPVGPQIDHFELSAASTELTCNPLAVTVKACLDPSCSQLYTDPVTATATVTQGNLSNSQALSFTGGSALYSLRAGVVGTASLGVSESTPPAKAFSQTQCRIGAATPSTNCQVTLVESGFLFYDPQTDTKWIPTHLSARPTPQDLILRAVKVDPDDPQRCVPGFASQANRNVGFAFDYRDPPAGEVVGTPRLSVNGTSITSGSTFTAVSLNFNAQAEAPFRLAYPDAGQLRLNALYAESETGLEMKGQSNDFVVRPYGLCLQTATLATCISDDFNCPLYPAGALTPAYPGQARAGDDFGLRIKAVAWTADGQMRTAAALCGNPTTPNYRQLGVGLSSQVQGLTGGANGVLKATAYDHALGTETTVSQSISEVGVFQLTATPPNYLGVAMDGGVSGRVGRFAPAYLSVSGSASLRPSCSTFSYQGQPMAFATGSEPLLTVTGKNRSGDTTQNYDRGTFWRLEPPVVGGYSSVTGVAGRDGRLQTQGAAGLTTLDADNGDGIRSFRWSGQTLLYAQANTPSAEDFPFVAAIRQSFDAASLTDQDAACYGTGAGCQAFTYDFSNDPGSQVRLGRLRLGNAHGSELQGLNLPLVIETWREIAGSSHFATEIEDTCSAPDLHTPALVAGTFTGNLADGDVTPSLSAIISGVGQLQLSAPGAGNDGSVQATLTVPDWLLYDWAGTGTRQAARGLAAFGIYQGSRPLIFRRELYR